MIFLTNDSYLLTNIIFIMTNNIYVVINIIKYQLIMMKKISYEYFLLIYIRKNYKMIYLAISIGIFGLAVALAYFNDSKKKNSTI